MTSVRRNVAVVGAGPAGLMAAEVLAVAGHAVMIYERMPSPARKFLMAGRGGLNLTHSEPLETFLGRYRQDASLVQAAVTQFTPGQTIAWVQSLGQETFTGSSGRMFPKAMKASPLLRAWLQRLAVLGVVLKTRHTWTGFDQYGALSFTTSDGTHHSVRSDATILALGGATWPKLGSDGSWVPLLSANGVTIAELMPSNCGVLIHWSEIFSKKFAGTPLKRVAVSIANTTQRGEAMITAGGLEGGAIYGLGPVIRAALKDAGSALLSLDLKPDSTVAQLTERLSRPRGSQSLSNHIRKSAALEPAAIAVLREPGPLPHAPEALARLIKGVPLTVSGLAPIERAISTAGGVRATNLDGQFMLKARPGVFLAGEMLDWDAPTGGYLLQACFATGRAAAEGALKWLEPAAKT